MSSRERAKELYLQLSLNDDAFYHIDLIAAALAAPALGWTKDAPKEPGWYWWRQVDAHEIVGVTEIGRFAGRWCYCHDDDWLPLEHAKVEIAGPLEVPT